MYLLLSDLSGNKVIVRADLISTAKRLPVTKTLPERTSIKLTDKSEVLCAELPEQIFNKLIGV